MYIQVSKTGSADDFYSMMGAVSSHPQVKSILILACDGNGFTKSMIDPVLRRLPKPVFGGIFPEILYGREKMAFGFVIAGLFQEARVQIVDSLSDSQADYEAQLEANLPEAAGKTMLVLVDGLATRITSLIDSLFNIFGLEFNYIGGGAGSLSFLQKPCLFANQGLIEDSAVLVQLKNESGVGVSHGWVDVDGPFRVTESTSNRIITLDWRPAFEVYCESVEMHSQKKLTPDNFYDIAKNYPFGINKLGAEKIVRDPLKVGPDQSLICVGEVPQESYVHILTGNADSLVCAVQDAMERSRGSYRGQPDGKFVLLMDCYSRVLFLEDKFSQEIDAVYSRDCPLIGALTIGEIANNGGDYLEFYNKSSVVAVLEDGC